MKNKLVTTFRVDTTVNGGSTDYTTTSTFHADGRIEYRTVGKRNGDTIDDTETLQADGPLDLDRISNAYNETGHEIISLD